MLQGLPVLQLLELQGPSLAQVLQAPSQEPVRRALRVPDLRVPALQVPVQALRGQALQVLDR